MSCCCAAEWERLCQVAAARCRLVGLALERSTTVAGRLTTACFSNYLCQEQITTHLVVCRVTARRKISSPLIELHQ